MPVMKNGPKPAQKAKARLKLTLNPRRFDNPMNTTSLYESIHQKNIACLREGNILVDPYLRDSVPDLRRGISLIIPLIHIAKNYERATQVLRKQEPGQYYYPSADLHITVFDLISAHPRYSQSAALDDTFVSLANEVLATFSSFYVTFKGIVFSREAGLLTGYDNGSVVALREKIRAHLPQYGIANTERYESKSVHATFVRFRKALIQPSLFADVIESCREVEIGEEPIQSISLVEHDWYNRKISTRTIKTFPLK
jgi:2'-5' RNA ligase